MDNILSDGVNDDILEESILFDGVEEESSEENILISDDEIVSETNELVLIEIDDLPLVEYGAIGMGACGAGLLVSLGVSGILSILRKA